MKQSIALTCLLLAVLFLIEVEAAADCSNLPQPINPHSCCRFPELFKNVTLDYCKHARHESQCYYDCVFTASEICRRRKCSYNKAEDYVDWVLPADDVFAPIYKDAYRKCIAKGNEMRDKLTSSSSHLKRQKAGCDPLPEMIYLCVQNEIFISCPTLKWVDDDGGECSNQREFIEDCIRND